MARYLPDLDWQGEGAKGEVVVVVDTSAGKGTRPMGS